VLDYISTIATCLKPGGVWINLGPLLYHFEEMDEQSIELSMEEIFAVMDSHGLERVRQENDLSCTYTSNSRSMMRMQYHAVMFTAVNNK
jgi:carnosine N-methyltransferase